MTGRAMTNAVVGPLTWRVRMRKRNHGVHQTPARGSPPREDPVQRPRLDEPARQSRRSLRNGRWADRRRFD